MGIATEVGRFVGRERVLGVEVVGGVLYKGTTISYGDFGLKLLVTATGYAEKGGCVLQEHDVPFELFIAEHAIKTARLL